VDSVISGLCKAGTNASQMRGSGSLHTMGDHKYGDDQFSQQAHPRPLLPFDVADHAEVYGNAKWPDRCWLARTWERRVLM